MRLITDSSDESMFEDDEGETMTGSKRHPRTHWLRGRCESGAWSGTETVAAAWEAIHGAVQASHTMHEAYLMGFAQGLADLILNTHLNRANKPEYLLLDLPDPEKSLCDDLERKLTQGSPARSGV